MAAMDGATGARFAGTTGAGMGAAGTGAAGMGAGTGAASAAIIVPIIAIARAAGPNGAMIAGGIATCACASAADADADDTSPQPARLNIAAGCGMSGA